MNYYLILVSLFSVGYGEHVLMYIPWSSKSLRIQQNAILEGLLARGHQVTGVFPQEYDSKHENYTGIVISTKFPAVYSVMTEDMITRDGTSPWTRLFESTPKMLKLIKETVLHDREVCSEVIDTLDKAGSEISAIIVTGQFGFVCPEILHHYKVPIIAVSPPGHLDHWTKLLGNPSNPAYMPDMFLPMVEPLNLRERLISFVVHVMMDYEVTGWFLEKYTPLGEYTGLQFYRWAELLRTRVDLLLQATHFVTHGPSVLAPNTIEVGGLHCREGRPLPPHLQAILDSHPEGVVFVSFGSSIKPSQMGDEKMKVFLSTFSQLKYTVIWKWDGEAIPGLPSNVILESWVPQQDLLAHPNLAVFVTHGGLLSLQETIYHSTPIVGIPLGNDQKPNMMRAERKGYAVMMDWTNLNTRDLLAAINRVATDPEIRKRMDLAHSLFLDQKEGPLTRAIWWIEFTMRNRGAQFLRPSSVSLAWYQYHLIDVIAFIIAVSLISSILMLLCCAKLCKCIASKTIRKDKLD